MSAYRYTFIVRLAGWAVLVLALLASIDFTAKASVDREPVASSAAALVEAYGCADQPNPTHAVITLEGRTRYVGQRLTDKAIEQAVFGIDHGITVHRFCA